MSGAALHTTAVLDMKFIGATSGQPRSYLTTDQEAAVRI